MISFFFLKISYHKTNIALEELINDATDRNEKNAYQYLSYFKNVEIKVIFKADNKPIIPYF